MRQTIEMARTGGFPLTTYATPVEAVRAARVLRSANDCPVIGQQIVEVRYAMHHMVLMTVTSWCEIRADRDGLRMEWGDGEAPSATADTMDEPFEVRWPWAGLTAVWDRRKEAARCVGRTIRWITVHRDIVYLTFEQGVNGIMASLAVNAADGERFVYWSEDED